MNINYNHSLNLHTLEGPKAALPLFFGDQKPASLLDVGCGNGTWLKAAIEFGIPEVLGVDGVSVPPDKLHVASEKIQLQDLTRPWNLNKRFDTIICLEVAEHLDGTFARTLIESMVRHGDRIIFSAACPGQPGQHHVNCQWPVYWQQIFNDCGYVCSDSLRWKIWEVETIEPWYRQNVFCARRDPEAAGREPRIAAVIHPHMLGSFQWETVASAFPTHVDQIQNGRMSFGWYLNVPFLALSAKLKRKLS